MGRINNVNNTAVQAGDREIVIVREFDAPCELVFEAWTSEEHLSKWWGPDNDVQAYHRGKYR